jgi:uncharacterized LabA/DUF88 family protein
MLFYPQEKLALFIDGANLYGAAKGLQFDIDYKRLLELFARKGILVRAFYYTAVAEDQELTGSTTTASRSLPSRSRNSPTRRAADA